jgi:DNA polymerase-3 subunit beta
MDGATSTVEAFASAGTHLEIHVGARRLRDAISFAKKLCRKKSETMPVLTCVKLQPIPGAIVVEATDLDVTFRDVVPCEVYGRGAVLVQVEALLEALKPVDGVARLVGGRPYSIGVGEAPGAMGMCDVPIVHIDEWPTIDIPTDGFADLPFTSMQAILGRVLHAQCEDETRYNLNGAYIEANGKGELKTTTTDGHRLAHVRFDDGFENVPADTKVILPRKGVVLLNGLLSKQTTCGVNINTLLQCATFRVGLRYLKMRLVDGMFPAYDQVIPKPFAVQHEWRVNRMALRKQLAPFAKASSKMKGNVITTWTLNYVAGAIDLEMPRDELTLRAAVYVEGKATEAKPFKIGFNARYVDEALQAFETETVVLRFCDPFTPLTISADEEDGHLQVIMPMRV